jgi:hypothetical protein
MNATTARQPRPVTLASMLLLGIGVLFALLLYAVLRYPTSLSQGGQFNLLVIAGALLANAAAALWARGRTSDSLQVALEQGSRIGLLLGAFAVVNHVIEIFAAPDAALGAILGVSMWALLFLAFGGVASATYQRSGSLGLAIIASVWCALVSTIMTLLAGYTIALLFMPHMQQILQGVYAQSGMTDPQAFVIHNTLSSGASHALLTPIIGLVFGCAGGIAGAVLGSVQRPVAIALAVGELLLVTAGLAAIGFASSLDRSESPPYIMFGLLALGITMACAHSILTAIRSQSRMTR